jgi:LPXTG-motif cell wall-anchored protein
MKEKNNNWIWIGVGAAILIVGGVVIYRRNKKFDKEDKQEMLKSGARQRFLRKKSQSSANEPVFKNNEGEGLDVFPIGFGDSGYEVAVIQQYMNSTCKESLKGLNTEGLKVTGIWDEETQTAIETCSSLKRKEVDEDTFKRIYRDMEAAGILPQHK